MIRNFLSRTFLFRSFLSSGMPSPATSNAPSLMSAERTFTGKNRVAVKRDVLTYWHSHQSTLGLSLKDFLTHCRESPDGNSVVFRYDSRPLGRR